MTFADFRPHTWFVSFLPRPSRAPACPACRPGRPRLWRANRQRKDARIPGPHRPEAHRGGARGYVPVSARGAFRKGPCRLTLLHQFDSPEQAHFCLARSARAHLSSSPAASSLCRSVFPRRSWRVCVHARVCVCVYASIRSCGCSPLRSASSSSVRGGADGLAMQTPCLRARALARMLVPALCVRVQVSAVARSLCRHPEAHFRALPLVGGHSRAAQKRILRYAGGHARTHASALARHKTQPLFQAPLPLFTYFLSFICSFPWNPLAAPS